MSITIEKIYWLPQLKPIWNNLYKANASLSIFQSYEFMLNFWKNSWIYCLTHKEIPVFYLIKEDGKPRLIAPLCKKTNGTYEIMGVKNGCEYCDFIYADGTSVESYVRELVSYLKCPIVFARIKEQSVLYQSFVGKDNVKECGEEFCTNIPLPESYDEYYKGLSSSMRQNLRTAFNRLKRDGHSVSIKVINEENKCDEWNYMEIENIQSTNVNYHGITQPASATDHDFEEMLSLYYQRHKERYGEHTSKLKMWYMKHLNFMTKSLRNMSSAMNIMLYIDNELAAFMGGLISQGEEDYIVPRLSINSKYGFYSPGMLLVNETARYMINKTSIRNLDLSLGTETYKSKMGGVKFLIKHFVIFCR